GVTEAVQTVKEAVATAPDKLKETVAAVKESVMETVNSFSVTGCIQNHPLAALGTSTAGGFMIGYLLSGRQTQGFFTRPIMAQGPDVPVSAGEVESDTSRYATREPMTDRGGSRREPGLFESLFDMVGEEVRQLASQALSTAVASLKQSINDQV